MKMRFMGMVVLNEDLKSFKKASRSLPDHDGAESQLAFDFLEDVFRAAYEAYSTRQDIRDGESTFNALYIYPFLLTVCKALRDHSCQADFKRGEANLVAMSKQLIALGLKVDDKSQYKADESIKLYRIKQLEILLLEISGSLGNTDKVKINFDHHKGVFGSLAMLKTIADEFSLASVDLFQQGLLENSVNSLVALREDSPSTHTLSNIVNPSILRLIQDEDSAGMGNLGPFYSPPHD
ncbi:hypothetical protein V8B55DRAFT_1328378 [Mucor lusitanicus]|uniref:Uncharacterized protein n=1 Tax=Mucor lusitanicus CBS 277.49 TaxID=747725 RepID=A0A168N1I7_MUCCL|nr:hypothetical protein MUCCIDRAFT_109528 [Mucor lusitanicus CBS 277.49]